MRDEQIDPTTLKHYFEETGRVLRPGGRALFSTFVLDHYQGPGTAVSPMYDYEVPLQDADGQDYEGVRVKSSDEAELYISYSRERLEAMLASSGLTIHSVIPGTWSKSSPRGVCDQDLLVLQKPGDARVVPNFGF